MKHRREYNFRTSTVANVSGKVADESPEILSEREVAHTLDVDAPNEPRLKRPKMPVEPHLNQLPSRIQTETKIVSLEKLGQLALRVAEQSYARLEYRLQTGHRFTNPELSLQGASSLKGGMEALAKPIAQGEPDWGQINVQVNVAPGSASPTVTAKAKRVIVYPV